MGTSCSEPTAPSPAAGGTPSSAASPAAGSASFPAHGAHLRNADIEGLLLSFADLGCNTRFCLARGAGAMAAGRGGEGDGVAAARAGRRAAGSAQGRTEGESSGHS